MMIRALKKILPASLAGYLAHLRQHREAQRQESLLAHRNASRIAALLQGGEPVKLELGAGEPRGIAGWTYVDANERCDLVLDLSQPLPFPEGTVDAIYSSHLLEHFHYRELVQLLKECLRVLKPGGSFAAAVPDAALYLNAYREAATFQPEIFCRYQPAYHYHSPIDFVNYMAYMDGHHRYMFDQENLVAIVKEAGFRKVRLREFDPSIDLEVRAFQTIYVEGVK